MNGLSSKSKFGSLCSERVGGGLVGGKSCGRSSSSLGRAASGVPDTGANGGVDGGAVEGRGGGGDVGGTDASTSAGGRLKKSCRIMGATWGRRMVRMMSELLLDLFQSSGARLT